MINSMDEKSNAKNKKKFMQKQTAIIIAATILLSSLGLGAHKKTVAGNGNRTSIHQEDLGATNEENCDLLPMLTNPTAPIFPLQDTRLLPLNEANEKYKQYGRFLAIGMPYEEYQKAMNQEWRKAYVPGEPDRIVVDLRKFYAYKDYEWIMLNLSRYKGVDVYVIGKSEKGRNIYAISVNFGQNENAPRLMFEGQIHAREFAGSGYILKMISDLVIKAQTCEATRAQLSKIRIEAVPVANPDGREMNIASGSTRWNGNANGVDLNRNFISSGSSQVGNGYTQNPFTSSVPDNSFYPGPYLGSAKETQALMKWIECHIPHAYSYISIHMQGGGIYCGRDNDIETKKLASKKFGEELLAIFNRGVSSNKYSLLARTWVNNTLDGTNGFSTAYAYDVAMGYKFDPSLGRLLPVVDGVGMPSIQFKSLENIKHHLNPINPDIRIATIEVGIRVKGKAEPLGYTATTREMHHRDYFKYNFDKLLPQMFDMCIKDMNLH